VGYAVPTYNRAVPPPIGIDARAAFLDPYRGFGRVTRSLVEALLDLLPGEILLFVPHGAPVPARWYPLAAGVVQLRRPRRPAFLVDGPAWALTLRRVRVGVLHLPAWGVPPGLPCPRVATFHDATPLRYPSPPHPWSRWRARRGILSLARASIVHAVSRAAAGEAAAHVGIPVERLRVVYWGVGPPFGSPAREPGGEHLLFVGGGDPHKNLGTVLDALGLPGAASLPPLVVAGPAAASGALREIGRRGGLAERVVLAPARTDDELAALYRGALATVVPSPNEGFGLPALEAMACGCPVVAASAGALPEVCGHAALLVEPHRAEAWRDGLLRLRDDAALRRRLAAAGVERAASFTWQRTAEGMVDVYREAMRR
jgi:glycosyltransferase involved in cell wall biosynthesis